jgi:hypothetical protein
VARRFRGVKKRPADRNLLHLEAATNKLAMAVSLTNSTLQELSEDLAAKLGHIDYLLSLHLEITKVRLAGDRAEMERLSDLLEEVSQAEFDLVETEEVYLRRRLNLLTKNLGELQLQEALHGITPPLYLINTIADTQARIEQVKADLAALLEKRLR